MTSVIVDAAVRSLALGGLVWVAAALLRLRNPYIEKLTWTTVLVSSCVMPALVRWVPAPHVRMAISVPAISAGGALMHAPFPWVGILSALYLLVVGALVLRLGLAFVRLWLILRGASRVTTSWAQGADIRLTAAISSPVTFGSTVLLPWEARSWSETRRRAVIAHELAHVRALDCYVLWLAAIHVCLFWFSPFSWWLRARLASLAEYSSDNEALKECDDRADYAQLLLDAARTRGALTALSIATVDVSRRIDRVLSQHELDAEPGLRRRALAIVLLLPAVGICAYVPGLSRAALPDPAGAQPPQAATTAAATTDEPRIISVPPDGLARWYPEGARRKGVDGLVQLAVTLDEAGRATDTQVLSEFPSGEGFAAAASGLAHEFTYINPTGHPATFTFNVTFKLREHPQSSGTTNWEHGRTTNWEHGS